MGEEVMDKLNALAAEGWEIDKITAAPLTTAWISPRGGTAAAGFTDKVHYLAMLRRSTQRRNRAPAAGELRSDPWVTTLPRSLPQDDE